MASTDQDGSFRRLAQIVKNQQPPPRRNKPGRPPKNRVPTTGHFSLSIHDRMKVLAGERTAQVDHLVSVADLYNEAARQLITDLHALLGPELQLPAGAVTISGILGLRELVDNPIRTPLSKLELQAEDQQRTTLYFDQPVWDAMMEMSLRFGLQLRQYVHIHRLLELAAAWYLAGLEVALD